ncbi:MAG: hypothetical protein N3B11_03465 [Coriobacteriia bacterium]|nr:hypothetical protein [Coriobacteriia bacterium]
MPSGADARLVAAIVFAALAAIAVLFQVALALGAPWGAYAMGGRFPGRLPPRMRLLALLQAALLSAMTALVLATAGASLPGWDRVPRWSIWGVVGVSALSLVLNVLTPSARERRVWAPAALVMLLSSLAVAIAAQ